MMMPNLHLRLLGDFSLIYADRQVTSLNTIRLQSLLAYLVLHRDVPQQRQDIAFLFWPDTTETQARNNLRQLLYQLRQVFPAVEHFLSADTHTLHWHPVTPFHLDVAEFELSWASHGQRNTSDSVHGSLYPSETRTREREVEELKGENCPLRWRCADPSTILALRFSCACVTQHVYS